MCVLSGYVRGVRATCTMIHLAVNATQQREIVLQYSIHSSFVDSVCSRCGARKLPSFVCVCVWLLCMHAYKCACAKVHYNPLLNFFLFIFCILSMLLLLFVCSINCCCSSFPSGRSQQRNGVICNGDAHFLASRARLASHLPFEIDTSETKCFVHARNYLTIRRNLCLFLNKNRAICDLRQTNNRKVQSTTREYWQLTLGVRRVAVSWVK